jgi:hypothetical protein
MYFITCIKKLKVKMGDNWIIEAKLQCLVKFTLNDNKGWLMFKVQNIRDKKYNMQRGGNSWNVSVRIMNFGTYDVDNEHFSVY